jgi:2-keto-4-pentenoate hydratase/2-oxohepta-3-ene-1,7-dioic acid hydratase in catechol pathway
MSACVSCIHADHAFMLLTLEKRMLKKYFLAIAGLIILCAFSVTAQNKKVFCRYEKDGAVYYGKVEGNEVYQLDNAPWDGGKETGVKSSLDDVKLLTPTQPHVIIGLIKSYSDSWKDKQAPESIRWFIKPSSAAATSGEDIVLPDAVDQLKFENEMVIVIGKKIKDVGVKVAKSAVFGYTVGADIEGNPDSYYKLHNEKPEANKTALTLGLKIGDRFSPYGPFITQGVDWKKSMKHVHITNKESGKDITYEHNVSDLMYSPAEIVSQLSKVLTLMPGDVIYSGSAKVFPIDPGDVIDLSIDGLGRMVNKIVSKNEIQ